jgi:hypothetical protein
MRTTMAVCGAAFVLLLGIASSAHASTIILASCFTGDCADLPSDYAVRLTLTDVTHDFGEGLVSALQVGVSPTTATGMGDLGSVYLDFSGSVAPAPWALTVSTSLVGTPLTNSLVRFPRRGGTAAGGFAYDLELDFHPPGRKGSGFLSPGETVTFTIAGLSADRFAAAIAHVQRAGPTGESGAHVRVPDSVSVLPTFGLTLLALALVRRRLRG